MLQCDDLKIKTAIMGILCDMLCVDRWNLLLPEMFSKEYFVGKQMEDLNLYLPEPIEHGNFNNLPKTVPNSDYQLLSVKIVTVRLLVLESSLDVLLSIRIAPFCRPFFGTKQVFTSGFAELLKVVGYINCLCKDFVF